MPILAMCSNPQCGELFDVPDEAIGKQVRCSSCGTVQLIKADGHPAESVYASDEILESASFQALPAKPEPPKPQPVKESIAELPPAKVGQKNGTAAGMPSPAKTRAPLPAADCPKLTVPAKTPRAPQDMGVEPGNAGEVAPEPFEMTNVDAAAFEAASDGALENKNALLIILVLGLTGIISGAIIAMVAFPDQKLIAMYVGGVAGWAIGFILAFLLVLNVERGGPRKVHCRVCYNVYPAQTRVCRWCGAPLEIQAINPLALDCLKVMTHARSYVGDVFWMAMSLTAGYIIFAITFHATDNLPRSGFNWRLAAWGLWYLTAFFVFTSWLLRAIGVIRHTLARHDTVMEAVPGAFSLSGVWTGIKGLLLLAIYVVPVVTIPLLPMGSLFLGSPRGGVALRIAAVVRSAQKYAKNYIILWLILLLWFVLLFLACAILWSIMQKIGFMIERPYGFSGIVLWEMLWSIAVAIEGAVVALFGLAIARCIGLFGIYNRCA